MATLPVFLLKKKKLLPMLPAVDLQLCGVVLRRREKESVRVEGVVTDDDFCRCFDFSHRHCWVGCTFLAFSRI